MKNPYARLRSNDVGKDIELISPEEIGEAAVAVLKKEYSMPKDDLVIQTTRVLGFKRVTEAIYKYVARSINNYMKKNRIIEINGRYTFNDNEDEECAIEVTVDAVKQITPMVEKKGAKKNPKSSFNNIGKMIEKAIKERQDITIEYHSPSKGSSVRKIEPHSYDGIYIKAYCHLVNDNRTFRIDRIKKLKK